MRILYGVVGEGMGHATRSKVVCEYLESRGHSVKIVVSGRAHAYLAKSFSDVVEIRGLTIRYVENAMDRDGTLARNVLAAPSMLMDNVAAYYARVVDFEPELVVTDFDSFAHLFAKRHGLPVISIDNQQIIARCKHHDDIKRGVKVDYQLTKAFVKAKLPRCDHTIITTFFQPPVRKKFADTTTLVPPILRKSILAAKERAKVGDHVLVYQTSLSNSDLLPALNRITKEKFVVYGLRRNDVVGNCVVKDFDEVGFVHDLATAKAVVTNGGLSLLGESVYLGKPVYSVPVEHQFEQVMNARYLEELGYGLATTRIDPDILNLFLREVPKYAARVAKHSQRGNELLFRTLDDLVHHHAKKAKKRRKERERERERDGKDGEREAFVPTS
ncbi:MAG: MJ1255/VC2487 family glycosyltransferase [Polyangiaceae bacterium]